MQVKKLMELSAHPTTVEAHAGTCCSDDMSKAGGHGIRILDTLKTDPCAFLAFYKHATKVMVLDSLHFLLDVNEYKSLPPFLR
jgi:hypothetical protein